MQVYSEKSENSKYKNSKIKTNIQTDPSCKATTKPSAHNFTCMWWQIFTQEENSIVYINCNNEFWNDEQQ